MASKKLAKAEAQLRQKAQVHWKKAKNAFVSAERKVKTYIKQHPKRAVAIAAGVAAAIGAAVMLAHRKKK